MGQKGQRSDTHTLTHEAQTLTRDVVTAPFRLRTYRLIRKILIGFILVSIANVLFSYFFYTPKMYRIIRENRDLVIKYRILQDRIRTAQRHVDEIRHRDNYVYRSLFSTDTMSIEGVWQPYPDTKYAALLDDDYAPLMVGTWRQLDALARTLYLESVSFDELQAFSQDKEKMSAAVPAIWPIDRSALHNNHIGAFSPRRYHPVLHRVQAHTGVDFGCDRGTPVYATGDGEVELAVGSGYNGGAQQQRQPQPDDPFASFWGAYGGNPYGNAGYGGYGSAGYGQAQQDDSIEMRAAKNYIDTGHYAEALNALGSVPAGKRNARWYFLSALAQSGLHNNAQAMEYARQAASMEPGNMQYQQLLSQLQGGGSWYSQQGQEYGRRTGGMNSVCTTFMLLNLCCACCGGGRMMYAPLFCCI